MRLKPEQAFLKRTCLCVITHAPNRAAQPLCCGGSGCCSHGWVLIQVPPETLSLGLDLRLHKSECKRERHSRDYLEASLIYESQNLLQVLVQNCWQPLLVTHLTQLTVMSPLTSTTLGLNLIPTWSNSGILPHPEQLPPLIFPVRNLQALSQQLSTPADISLSPGATHGNSIYLFWGRSLASTFLQVSKGHKCSSLAPRFGLSA